MPKGKIPSTYIYKPTDSVESLAAANGTTPQALINANPGGYPFSTGQNILLPGPVMGQNPGMSNPFSIYSAGSSTAGAPSQTHPNPGFVQTQYYNKRVEDMQTRDYTNIAQNTGGAAPVGYGPYWQQQRLEQPGGASATGGGGFTSPSPWSQAWVNSQWHRARENQSMSSIPGVSNTAQYLTNYLATDRLPPSLTSQQIMELKNSGMDVSGFATFYDIGADGKLTLNEAGKDAAKAATSSLGTPGAGEFYGYERDPVTGRSVRVIKNSATSSFLNELRWDPDRKKYVKIGDLMRQGKLDPSGRWNSRGNKKGGRRPRPQKAVAEDAVQVSNDFVSFNVSSG